MTEQISKLKLLWQQDTDKTNKKYPKVMKKDGLYTDKFVKYNEKLIKEGKTNYHVSGKYYFPTTGRFRDIKKFDKRYKKKKFTKQYEKLKPLLIGNVFSGSILGKTVKQYSDDVRSNINKLKNNQITYFYVDLKKIKLTDFMELIRRLAMENNFVMSSVGSNSKYFTLSQLTIQKLLKTDRLTKTSNKSDSEVILNAIVNDGIIKIEKIATTNNRSVIAGSFFPYYHKTDENLTRYDIYNKKDELNFEDNCLFVAFEQAGISDSKLNKYKTFVRNAFVPLNKMNTICDGLEIRVKLTRNIDGITRTSYYGKKGLTTINIGLIKEHYFINEKTNFTSYSLKNYKEVKDIRDYKQIVGKRGNSYRRDTRKYITSFEMFKILIDEENDLIVPIPYKKLIETPYYNSLITDDLMNINDKEMKENKLTETDNTSFYKVFFDFETCTEGSEHTPYLMCCITEDGEERYFEGENCAYQFIQYIKTLIPDRNKKEIMLIAHNMKYDMCFIWQHFIKLQLLPKGNRIMGGSALLPLNTEGVGGIKENIFIQFQDSLNIIPESLKKFGKMFNLEQAKEIMPYSLYTQYNISKKNIPIDECLKSIELIEQEDKELFLNNSKKWNCIDDNKIDIIEYSKKYCEIDCIVLKQGYDKFRGWVKNIMTIENKPCNLDIVNYCSAPSLVNDYMIQNNVYQGCYKISGIVQAFIQKTVVGGRCMTANNKKYKIEEDIADYDGVSLYPSAMSELGGLLKGTPMKLKKKELNMEFLNSIDGYFVKVKCINNPTKRYDFPLLSNVNEDGIRMFTNETKDKEFYIDKFSLEDAMEFQGLKFDIICGYYYNEGRNYNLKKTINILFNERLQKKKEGNPVQAVYKLFMNSAYGKSLLKPIDEDTKIVYKKDWDKFINRHYNFIKDYTHINNQLYIVKLIKPINTHFNNVYAGVEILSISKRIMNRVMTTAQDIGAKVYITDTDSMHIQFDKVKELEKAFKDKYNKDLTGKGLGMFHVDFSLECSKTKEKAIDDTIKSKRSIYLGKKCYIDELEGITKSGKTIVGYHMRMKGIPSESILYECKKQNITPFELYTKLYEDETITFDLLCGGQKCKFKFDGLSVKSLGYVDENKQRCGFDSDKYDGGIINSEFARAVSFK